MLILVYFYTCTPSTEPQIRQIVDSLENPALQTLFFTATWPREVQQMANTFLTNPVQLKIGNSTLCCFILTMRCLFSS